MEIKKLPKKDVEKELSESKSADLFTKIALGQDVTEKIETSRGTFEIKFPRMRDIQAIYRLNAAAFNGYNVLSFDVNARILFEEIAMLDVLVISGPAWYENAKRESGFTWADCPSQSFIQEVAGKASEFRLKVQKQIEQTETESREGKSTVSNSNDTSSPQIFDGLSSSD